jgi:hypothetical protein
MVEFRNIVLIMSSHCRRGHRLSQDSFLGSHMAPGVVALLAAEIFCCHLSAWQYYATSRYDAHGTNVSQTKQRRSPAANAR